MQSNTLKREMKIIAVSMVVYVLNRLFKNSINIPVIGYLCRCHLNDFIGGIVFTAYINILLIFGKFAPIRSPQNIIMLMLFAGICWEYIIPRFTGRGVADIYDILSYILGGLFYCFINYIIDKSST